MKKILPRGRGEKPVLVNLKAAIAARGLKQYDICSALKIHPSVLSEIIHERREADASLRARLAERLGADEAWLFQTVTKIPAPAEPALAAAT